MKQLYFYKGHSFEVSFCKISQEWKATSFKDGKRHEMFSSESKDWVISLCKESIEFFLDS